jgi:hypothetical protein
MISTSRSAISKITDLFWHMFHDNVLDSVNHGCILGWGDDEHVVLVV